MRKIQFAKGNFYHLYNRGTEKRSIFQDDNDRWRFLQGMFLFNDSDSSMNVLAHCSRSLGRTTFGTLKSFLDGRERKPLVGLIGDCLMPNHYHLLVEETEENGISKFMQKLGTGYTMYFNTRHERSGSLFQGRFKSVLIKTQEQLEYLLFYINVINPAQLIEPSLKDEGVKNISKVLKFVDEYLWSTHQECSGKRESIIINKSSSEMIGEIFSNPEKYQEFILAELEGKKFETMNKLLID